MNDKGKIIGVVLERNGNSWFSKVIRWFTKSTYSHIEFIYDDVFTTVGAREGSGVKYRTIKDFNEPEIFIFCDAETQKHKPLTKEEHNNLNNFIEKNLDMNYDYQGIWGYLTYKDQYNKQDAWFCSEFVAVGLYEIGRALFHRKKNLYVTPSDCAMSLRLKKME